MNRKSQLIMGILLLVVGTVFISVPLVQIVPRVKEAAAVSFFDRLGMAGGFEQELKTGECITIVDEKSGAVVDAIARVVYVGDEIISESNQQYRVIRVKGSKAFAKKTGIASDMVWKEESEAAPAGAGFAATQGTWGKTQVAIYYTHSDESYVPTDGDEAIPGKGGIFQVGESLASALRANGISVAEDKTPHEPHDSNAYHRSRRTAVQLLKKRPIAMFDIHRDGIPNPKYYNKIIQGDPVTKIRLVVGRQNPNMAANLQFAKNIKAYMDKHRPGLIKGIFIGRGDYNQDLAPRALLLEVGTYTNNRLMAERGAQVFAGAIPAVLNIKPTGGFGVTRGESRSIWSTIGWIIGIVIVAGIGFLFISTGSVKGMGSKLGELRKTEFANFLGLRKIGRKRPDKRRE